MGYLVKASFNAEPRAYSLESIKDDVAAKALTAGALVRHEKQDFWYSVGELIGESPTADFPFTCPHCQAKTEAREIDVGLEVPCQKCGSMVLAPDIKPIKPATDPTPDLPGLRRGNHLLFWGTALVIEEILSVCYSRGGFDLTRITILELVGVCMMINGYGKRKLFYLKHPKAAAPASSFFAS